MLNFFVDSRVNGRKKTDENYETFMELENKKEKKRQWYESDIFIQEFEPLSKIRSREELKPEMM